MVVGILKGYMYFIIAVMLLYTLRHFTFTVIRLLGRQRLYYGDIVTSRMKTISVLIPMHNEELVLRNALDALLECDYDRSLMEIIPINDHSTDRTGDMLEEYHAKYDFIRPLHRYTGRRGKPSGLNDAMKMARGEIIVVFDADYRPARNLLKQISLGFEDPHVGAVMGRVIPYNTNKNMLTRLITLERSGGYQVDQQARYNLGAVPQYGGTVGGFRKDYLLETGGFRENILAEDTELTYRLFTNGWKVLYANSAECYEESPETWNIRGRQIRRWSRGHNQVLFHYLIPTLRSPYMTFMQKADGVFLLFVYAVPMFTLVGWLVSMALYFLGEMDIMSGWWVILFLGVYDAFGNFAPFFEVGTSMVLDGTPKEALLLPLLMFNFFFYMWHISLGFVDAVTDVLTGRAAMWDKTARFAQSKEGVR